MANIIEEQDDDHKDEEIEEGMNFHKKRDRTAKESIFSVGHAAPENSLLFGRGEDSKVNLAELACRLY